MRIFIGLLSFFFCFPSFASEGCFAQHVVEASQINQARRPTYRQLAFQSGGIFLAARSVAVSSILIFEEWLLDLVVAGNLDRRSEELASFSGIHYTCLGLMPMTAIGNMSSLPRVAPGSERVAVEGFHLQRELLAMTKGHDVQNLPILVESLRSQLLKLNRPTYNCMARHLMESTLRFIQISLADRGRLENPQFQKLTWDMAELQLSGLAIGTFLDYLAEPLQQMGLPIICNDVPSIPEFH